MDTLSFIIVEDNQEEAARLTSCIQQFASERNLAVSIQTFTGGKYLLEAYPKQPDLIFLDIDMEFMSGIEAAHRIRVFDSDVQILFVTRMIQFALEGYEVNAADFIVKPLSVSEFSRKLDRVVRKILRNRPRFLKVTACSKEEQFLRIQQITCIEALNKKTIIHRQNEEDLVLSQPLYQLEKELAGEPFFRCHNAFLVNLGFVISFSCAEISLPGRKIPVSKYRKRAFLQALTSYRGEML